MMFVGDAPAFHQQHLFIDSLTRSPAHLPTDSENDDESAAALLFVGFAMAASLALSAAVL